MYIDRRTHPAWDGYYYTLLTPKEYEQTFKKRGRPRKHITVHKKVFYKYKDACNLDYIYEGYVIKFKYVTYKGFRFYKEKLVIDDPIVVEYHKSLKFADISVHENDYELL